MSDKTSKPCRNDEICDRNSVSILSCLWKVSFWSARRFSVEVAHQHYVTCPPNFVKRNAIVNETPGSIPCLRAQPYGFDFRKKRIFVFLWVFRPIHKGVRYFTDDGTLTSFVAREIPNRFRLFQGVKVLQEPAVSLQPWRKIVLERRCGI